MECRRVLLIRLCRTKRDICGLATQKGLVRYDGYKTKVYYFGIEDPYLQNVYTLYLDREDRLWGGGEYGVLFQYDRSEDRFINYKPGASASDSSRWPIYKICEDQHGHIWLLSYDFNKKKAPCGPL